MKKFLIGRSPLTTIAGFLLAALMSIHQAGMSGAHSWQDFLLPASVAILGRLTADDNNNRPPLPPLPMPSPGVPDLPPTLATSFLRKGRQHSQKRGRNGRFATATA